MARYLGIPQFSMDKINEESGRGLTQYKRNFRRLLIDLQEFTGEEIKDDNLQRVADCCNRSTQLYWDLWELKKQAPCPVPGIFSPFTYGARFTMWGRPEGAELLQACVDTSRRIMQEGSYPAGEEFMTRQMGAEMVIKELGADSLALEGDSQARPIPL